MNKLVKERMRSHEYFNQRKFDEGNDKSKRKWMANKRRLTFYSSVTKSLLSWKREGKPSKQVLDAARRETGQWGT